MTEKDGLDKKVMAIHLEWAHFALWYSFIGGGSATNNGAIPSNLSTTLFE